MKARDIIHGWPRGKSVSSPSTYRDPDSETFGRSLWYTRDWSNLIADIRMTNKYHQQQSAMLDDYHSEYRRPTPAWLARKIMTYGGGMVIASSCEDLDRITLGSPTAADIAEERHHDFMQRLGKA